MAETTPGGRYRRSDGVLVDAHGNTLEETPQRASSSPNAPADVPPAADATPEPPASGKGRRSNSKRK